MAAVARLGALAFNTTNIPEWRRILVGMLGMEERPRTAETDPMLIRYDDLEYRLAFHPSEDDGLRLMTWEVDTPEELREIAAQVEGAGIAVEWHEHGDNDTRDWTESITFKDPQGFPLAVRYGATWDHNEFRPSGIVSGFVTSPFDQPRICSGLASATRIESKLFTSSMISPRPYAALNCLRSQRG